MLIFAHIFKSVFFVNFKTDGPISKRKIDKRVLYIYIYIYIEREREREREYTQIKKKKSKDTWFENFYNYRHWIFPR